MPKGLSKEPRTRGNQKKNGTVIGRFRGISRIVLRAVDRNLNCEISGRRTNLVLEAGDVSIPCYSAFLDKGIQQLRSIVVQG